MGSANDKDAVKDECPKPLVLHIGQHDDVPVVGSGIRKGGWRAACFILATEAMERLAFYSIAANLVTYLLTEMHEPLPKAVNMVTNWIGAAYVLGIPGGFLADAYLGRFCTIAIYSGCYILGLTLVMISATVRSLRPSCAKGIECGGPSNSHEGVLYAGMYMIAVGTGGIKPCVSTFGANQFEDHRGTVAMAKKSMASFFNWFFFAVNIGALFAFTVVVYVQDNVGWGPGLAIPLAGMVASLLLLFCGLPLYHQRAPQGSPLTRLLQVMVAAFRYCCLPQPSDTQLFQGRPLDDGPALPKLPHTQAFRLLDRAATPKNLEKEKDNLWRLCTMTQVEECKLFLKILPIMATTLFLWTGYTQLVTFFVKQGSTLDRNVGSRHFQIPPASLPVFSVINALIVLPCYDKFIVPLSRRLVGHPFSPLQRMGFGLFVSILSMVVAAFVERHRLYVVRQFGLQDEPSAIVPMTIFWLVPQYFLVGLAEIFTYVGQLEFFYGEVSEAMQSLSTSFFIAELGIGSWISSLLVTIVRHVTGFENGWITDNINRSKIDYFYWLLAILSALNFLLFLICASLHRYNSSNATKPTFCNPRQ
ncbi:hypothetical protein L7F22_037712 [Adiantum nelumboides]|nr:hypothetical protein [Adiantum nelumboides]